MKVLDVLVQLFILYPLGYRYKGRIAVAQAQVDSSSRASVSRSLGSHRVAIPHSAW